MLGSVSGGGGGVQHGQGYQELQPQQEVPLHEEIRRGNEVQAGVLTRPRLCGSGCPQDSKVRVGVFVKMGQVGLLVVWRPSGCKSPDSTLEEGSWGGRIWPGPSEPSGPAGSASVGTRQNLVEQGEAGTILNSRLILG